MDYLLAGMSGLVVSLPWLYLRCAVRPVIPVLLVPLTALTVGLVFSLALFLELPRRAVSLHHQDTMPSGQPGTALTGSIQQGRNYSLYIGRHTGSELTDTILVNHREIPRMRRYGELQWNFLDQTLLVPGGVDISTQELFAPGGLREPMIFSRLAEDMRLVIRALDGPLSSPPLIATLLAISFSMAMVWTAARLTRWPLANGVLVLAIMVVILGVPRFLETYGVHALLAERFAAAAALPLEDYLLPAILLLPGLVLLVVGFFLPRFSRWQREMLPLGESS